MLAPPQMDSPPFRQSATRPRLNMHLESSDPPPEPFGAHQRSRSFIWTSFRSTNPSFIVCPQGAPSHRLASRVRTSTPHAARGTPAPATPAPPTEGPPLRCVPSAHRVISLSLRGAAGDRDAADGHREGAGFESNHGHGPAFLRGGAHTRLGQLRAHVHAARHTRHPVNKSDA